MYSSVCVSLVATSPCQLCSSFIIFILFASSFLSVICLLFCAFRNVSSISFCSLGVEKIPFWFGAHTFEAYRVITGVKWFLFTLFFSVMF